MKKKILVILYGLGRQQLLAASLIAKIKELASQSEIHLVAESNAKETIFLIEDISYFYFLENEKWDIKNFSHWDYHSIFNFSAHPLAREITAQIRAEEKSGFISLQNEDPSWTSTWFKHIEEYQENEGRDLFHLLDLWRLGLKMDKVGFPKTREMDTHFQTLAISPVLEGDKQKAENIFKILQNLHGMSIGLNFQWLTLNDEDHRLVSEVIERHLMPLKIVELAAHSLKDRLSEVSLLVTDNQSLIHAADFYSDVPILALYNNIEEGKTLGPYRKGSWLLTPLKDNTGQHIWNQKLISEVIAQIMESNDVEILRWSQENSHLLLLSRTNLFLDGKLWSAVPLDMNFRISHFRSLIENVVWILALNEEKNIGSAAFVLAHEIGVQDRFLGHLIFWENEASWLEGRLNSYTWLDKDENEWGHLIRRVDNSSAWKNLAANKSPSNNLQDLRRQKEFKELNIKRIQIKGRLIQQIQSFAKEPSA